MYVKYDNGHGYIVLAGNRTLFAEFVELAHLTDWQSYRSIGTAEFRKTELVWPSSIGLFGFALFVLCLK